MNDLGKHIEQTAPQFLMVTQVLRDALLNANNAVTDAPKEEKPQLENQLKEEEKEALK